MSSLKGSFATLLLVVSFWITASAPSQGQEAVLLGEGVISTEQIEYGPALSIAEDTLFFTRRASFGDSPQIYFSVKRNTTWSKPQKVSFSDPAGDELPFVSSNGRRLYFSSARTVPGLEQNGRNDMWFVERKGQEWSEPVHMGGALSTPDIDSHPVITSGGLYFHSRRHGGTGGVDAYFAPKSSEGFSEPTLLPFNSEATDGEVTIHPLGAQAVFYSDRPGGFGQGDLYYSTRNGSSWSTAINAGEAVNTAGWDWSPSFTPDGKRLLFARLNEAGDDSDIYSINTSGLFGK